MEAVTSSMAPAILAGMSGAPRTAAVAVALLSFAPAQALADSRPFVHADLGAAAMGDLYVTDSAPAARGISPGVRAGWLWGGGRWRLALRGEVVVVVDRERPGALDAGWAMAGLAGGVEGERLFASLGVGTGALWTLGAPASLGFERRL